MQQPQNPDQPTQPQTPCDAPRPVADVPEPASAPTQPQQPTMPRPVQQPAQPQQPIQPDASFQQPAGIPQPVQPWQAPASQPANPYQNQGSAQQGYQQTYAYGQPSMAGCQGTYPMSDLDRTLRLIAFALNILATVGGAILIIPLFWAIPMTIRSWGIYKGTKPNTVAFDVCTLIFLSLVSGILLLISKKDR
ncbi:MAG: hypothetical protein Q4B69_05640 [Slackia sp.]|nr:hypothetical protein [Slackia sp.]